MALWDDIPSDIAYKICEQIYSYKDSLAFGGVCRLCRHLMKRASISLAKRQTSWLMLAEPPCTLNRRFYGLHKGMIQHLTLPNVVGTTSNDDCMYFSTSGWLVCVTQSDLNTVLINPISGHVIQTPTFRNFYVLNNMEVDDDDFKRVYSKFALLGNPLTSLDYTLGVISCSKVGLWFSKDEKWIVQAEVRYAATDIAFYKGVLYSVADLGEIVEFTVVAGHISERVVASLHWPATLPGNAYVVESAGALFVILRVVEVEDKVHSIEDGDDQFYKTVDFKVWEVNVENGEVKAEVKNVGNRAVFVGYNSSFSVEACTPYCKANCIYYTDDLSDQYLLCSRGGGLDMGVYDLSIGKKIEDFNDVRAGFSFVTPPLWIEAKAAPSETNSDLS